MEYENMFKHFAYQYGKRAGVFLTFNEALAQKIYAACDIFLMPSAFEPCGLGQLMAMRYGTVPVVRKTGGLKDTVTPYNQYTGEGNGFSFANYNAHEMFFTLQHAINLYKNDKETWNNLVKNAMNTDNSWKKSAQDYMNIFNSLIG